MLANAPTKKVSYVVGTKDRPAQLERLLTNIREFIRPEDELIIFDGGSGELTKPVVDRFGDMVSLWRCEPDSGSSEAFNKAILHSRGEIIVNLNDDDYFYPDGVLAAVTEMESHPEIDALVCGGECVLKLNNQDEPITIKFQHVPAGEKLKENWRLIMNQCSAGFLLVRRHVFIRIGIFGSTIKASDTEFMSRLILSGLDFRYFDVKYFKHYSRVVSSQIVNEGAAQEDRVRVAFQHNCWPEAITYHKACERVMGLAEIPGGKDVFLILRFAEEIRRRCRPLIHVIGFLLRQVEKVYFLVNGRPKSYKEYSGPPPVEPAWDRKTR